MGRREESKQESKQAIQIVRGPLPFRHPEYLHPMPLLSTYNGPSYLLHAVETLYAQGIRHANVCLVPVIGWWSSPEVEPYYSQSNLAGVERIDAARFRGRLGINIREKSRLQGFLPLVVLGLTSPQQVREWKSQELSARKGYQKIYSPDPPWDGSESPVPDWMLEWTNSETPAERLARQLVALYPELRDPGTRLEAHSDSILTAEMIRQGRWHAERSAYFSLDAAPAAQERRIVEAPQRTALALVERFFTEALLLVATADMMGGFEYELQIEPQGREIEVTITPRSDVREVVRWLHAYPHHPLPDNPTQQIAMDMPIERRREWDDYFAQHPDHDNIFETASKLWTEADPAIIALFGDIRKQSEAGREIPFSSDEMLTLARKYLPDYLPHYPRQFAVTGGINMEGILFGLVEIWMAQEPTRRFLGISQEDLNRFSEDERMILLGLLVQRRQILDQAKLFQTAVRLLVGAKIETYLESYRLQPVRLGKPLAQPGRSLSLNGVCALHAPDMRVSIPMDRDRDPNAWPVEQKLQVIARLFLPLHIPMQMLWQVDRPLLGRTTYLRRAGATTGPATRLG